MQHTFTLAAWNFRLARRSLLALWGVFAAQQAAVILWRAAQPGAAGLGLASHYYATMQIFAYLGFYLLTALEAGLATHNSRRARSGYTWATLPVFASGLFCAWVCFYIVGIEQHLEWLLDEPRYAFYIAAAAVLAVLTVWWAVRSIRRGEAA